MEGEKVNIFFQNLGGHNGDDDEDNNYIEKLVTKRLCQLFMTFLILDESWHVAKYYIWFSIINQSFFF